MPVNYTDSVQLIFIHFNYLLIVSIYFSLTFFVNNILITGLYVSEATVEINKVAHHINENIRQRENFQKMLSIQNALTGEGAPKILAPGNQ